MKYTTENGELLEGNSLTQIFEALKSGSRFDSELTDEEFMQKFAFRFKEFYGTEVSTVSIDEFMNAIIAHGFLKKID